MIFQFPPPQDFFILVCEKNRLVWILGMQKSLEGIFVLG